MILRRHDFLSSVYVVHKNCCSMALTRLMQVSKNVKVADEGKDVSAGRYLRHEYPDPWSGLTVVGVNISWGTT